jgi:serine/threonine protein kinase/tetratricopeptide (TPR) repeat protein
MGVVYEAEDVNLGRRVALKFLPPQFAQDASSLERFQREARAASALNHPNICTVHAIEQHDGQPFIAMELLEGEPLSEAMRKQPLDIEQVLSYGLQIVDALESAHAKGIVHRDLKPANLFLTQRGQIKILDFGLAKVEAGQRASTAAGAAGGIHAMETAIGADLTSPGTTLGTVAYMSPEQARGQLTDARTDLFSFCVVLYQMCTGALPFQGDTSAVMFERILNHDPTPVSTVKTALPAELGRIVDKLLEKDRHMRYQTTTEVKTDLARLKRDLDSGRKRVAGSARHGNVAGTEKRVAVLYFENLSGAREDEYFRDGITEDIITELSKIRGVKIFPRPAILAFRDRSVTPMEVGQQLAAGYVLSGSLRRSGNRLRINAQLFDLQTDFPLWSERYDRELKDIFEVQDEIARSIAEALRITLSPQEKEAIAEKPTENLQAYDLYLKAKSYARRRTRQDLEFALQMLESAVQLDAGFALAHASMANVCAQFYQNHQREESWMTRAVEACNRAIALQPRLPEALVAQAWISYAERRFEDAIHCAEQAIERRRDCEGAYYVLGRALFSSGRYHEMAAIADAAVEASGDDYNVYVPIQNALGALGKRDVLTNFLQQRMLALEAHLQSVPEDARARTHLAVCYATSSRPDDAVRELNTAVILRPNDSLLLYNAACIFCLMKMKDEGLEALRKAWKAGYRDASWARRDPDLALLHEHPEFQKLYPAA